MLPDIYDSEINVNNLIWEGIVQNWATSDEIITFIDNYIESEHYAALSNHDQLGIDNFRRLIEYSLERTPRPSRLIYDYIEYRLGDYGWQLED